MKTLLLSGVFAFCGGAQTPTEPPPLLQLIRIPGSDLGSIRPYSSARAAINVFGMRAVTGLPETWLIEAHDSFASIETLDRAIMAVAPDRKDDVLAPPTTMIALFRPDWSYRPDLAVKMFPRVRYLHISVHRIRPGASSDFGELVRQRRSGFDRMNLDRPDIAYQVISGSSSETCIFLAPLTSLKTLDDALARIPDVPARGGAKTPVDIELSREHLLFRVEPQFSWVTHGFKEADPDFWQATWR